MSVSIRTRSLMGSILMVMLMVTSVWSNQSEDILLEQYKFDGEGRLISKITPDGSKTDYEYDEKGALTKISYPGDTVSYGYDANGNTIWMQDKTGVTLYCYDAFDRLIGVMHKHSPTRLIVYDYDPWDNLSSVSIFNPHLMEQDLKYKDMLATLNNWEWFTKRQEWRDLQFKFQEMIHRLRSEDLIRKQRWQEYQVKYDYYNITRNLKSIDFGTGRIEYSYRPERGEIIRQLPNGIKSTFSYSPSGELKTIRHEDRKHKPIAFYHYEYDPPGKVSSVIERTPDYVRTTSFNWDSRGYLKSLHAPEGNMIRFDYDAMGNRLWREDHTGTIRYEYDNFGRATQAGDWKFEWNKRGNLITQYDPKQTISFQYDARNQLTSVKLPDVTASYNWDGAGNMVSRTLNERTTHYLPDPLAPSGYTLAEYDRTGNMGMSYVYAGNDLLGHLDAKGGMHYYLEDGFNSIRDITDMKGNIVGHQDFTPFAEPISVKGIAPINFRRAGERFLPEIKSYDIGGRLYEPQSARYLTPDPLPGYMERFDSFNNYSHGCRAPGVFMEPRCNQAPKTSNTTSRWDQFGRTLFGRHEDLLDLHTYKISQEEFNRREKVRKTTWKAIPYALSPLTLHPNMGTSIYDASKALEGRTPSRMETNASALLWPTSAIAGAVFGGLPGAAIAVVAKPLVEESVGGLASFYGTRMDRPYWWWSPMKWIPQEEYLRRLEEQGKRQAALAAEAERGRRYKDDQRKFAFPPDGGNGGGGGPGGPGGPFGGGFNDPFKSVENQLGGIDLNAPAEFLGNLGRITGAVYDPETQSLSLVGDEDISLPSINPEDLAVALMCVYGSFPQDPQFSLDPADPKNPEGEWLKTVYIPEEIIAGTEFGKALLEADWLLKQYAFGISIDSNWNVSKRKSSVPSFKSLADFYFEDPDTSEQGKSWGRFWIVPDTMVIKRQGSSIYFDKCKMRVKAMKMAVTPEGLKDVPTEEDPKAMAFAELFTQLYDEIAKESPEFARVKELAKVVALAKWMKRENIPVDLDWVWEYAIQKRDTLVTVSMPALSLRWERRGTELYHEASLLWTDSPMDELRVFGGVDLTDKSEFIPDDGTARNLQQKVESALKNESFGPLFSVVHRQIPKRAVVLPVTETGQKMWNRSPMVVQDGVAYQYDPQTKLITKACDPEGNISEFSYDPENELNTVKIASVDGRRTHGERKDGGTEWSAVSPKGNEILHRYEKSGYLREIVVDGEKLLTCDYDQDQGRATIRYKDYVEEMSFDPEGYIEEYELRKMAEDGKLSQEKESVSFTYNDAEKVTKIEGAGVPLIEISYTDDGTIPLSVNTPQGEIQFSHDSFQRIKNITLPDKSSITFSYEDENLAKMQVNHPEGRQAEYLFGEDGIVQSRDFLGGVAEYGYQKGLLSLVRLAQGGDANYIYDDLNRLHQIRFPNGSWIEYQYQGQLLNVVTHPAPGYENEARQ
ncbi:MAG: hypothetical protein KAW16_07435 [candidate division Zixibacteria bacterium]|nr:hypothetical protein [candidate division Zixibacteria bacterium]